MTRRDDSQASSWPSWIEALLREMNQLTCAECENSSVDLCDLAYLCRGEGAEAFYEGGGTLRPPNANKETGIPATGAPINDSLRRVWKGATEEGARWSTLKASTGGLGPKGV